MHLMLLRRRLTETFFSVGNYLVGIITGCVVAALVLIGVVVGIVMIKKKGEISSNFSVFDFSLDDASA